MARPRTHKRLWLSEKAFTWLSSAGHMIPDGCYWNTFSVLGTIDTDCPWGELRAIFRLVGFWPTHTQTSNEPFDEDE
jgi:hypothetical protein